MAANFSFKFVLTEKEIKKICRNCCVKIDVYHNGKMVIRKYYCLHCGAVLSRSGMDVHKITYPLLPEQVKPLEDHFYQNIAYHEGKVKNILKNTGSRG